MPTKSKTIGLLRNISQLHQALLESSSLWFINVYIFVVIILTTIERRINISSWWRWHRTIRRRTIGWIRFGWECGYCASFRRFIRRSWFLRAHEPRFWSFRNRLSLLGRCRKDWRFWIGLILTLCLQVCCRSLRGIRRSLCCGCDFEDLGSSETLLHCACQDQALEGFFGFRQDQWCLCCPRQRDQKWPWAIASQSKRVFHELESEVDPS